MRLSGTLSAGGHRGFQLDCNADTEKEECEDKQQDRCKDTEEQKEKLKVNCTTVLRMN